MHHLFDMNVGPLLHTHSGERIHFHFEDEVEEHEWEDLIVLGKLVFDVDLIAIDDGVDVIIKNLVGAVIYETYEYTIAIKSVERTFVKNYSKLFPDDINPIDIKGATINLGKVIREEILMQVL